MKIKSIITVFLLVLFKSGYSQDSIKIESLLTIETKGTGILASGSNNIECITCVFETIQDNPFHHFAIYSGITHTLSVNDAFSFETGIFLEERSFSGGSNTVENWVVYPKILLTANDTITLFNQAIPYRLSGGDFWAEDFNDMLRIHNLDYQGIVAELQFNRHTFGFLLIGDLSKNIGIGLHQYHKVFIRSDFNKITNTVFFTENQLSAWENHIIPKDFNIGNNFRYQVSNYANLESQFELRLNDELGASFAAGFGISGKIKNLEYKSQIKYYEASFNNGYFSNRVLYRDGSSYIGEQLYPLKNFYRQYGQWGNYTKTQNRNLLGFELCLSWEKVIRDRLLFFSDIDLNVIGDPKTRTGNTIPLYTLGLRIKYFKFLKTEFFFTNKHMNLNSFYQTFQASKLPFFGGTVKLDLEKIRLRID